MAARMFKFWLSDARGAGSSREVTVEVDNGRMTAGALLDKAGVSTSGANVTVVSQADGTPRTGRDQVVNPGDQISIAPTKQAGARR
jgi:hypothetical protein